MEVYISGVGGNTAANGYWVVTVTGASAFSLNGSTGNGSYTSSTGIFADVPSWFQSDREKLLEYHAASQFARKNLSNDQTLNPAVMQEWDDEWEQGKERLLGILYQQDPDSTRYHFGVPRSVQQAAPQTSQSQVYGGAT
jgi:hypothetical protein